MTISIFKNFPIRLGWLCYTLDSKAHAWRKQVTLQLYQNNTQYCLLLTIETDAYMWALFSPSNKRKAHFINSAIFICFFQFALLTLIFMRYLFCFLQNCWNELRLQYNLKFDWKWNFQHFRVGTIGAHYCVLSHCVYVIITNDCDIDSSQWVWLSFVYDSVSANIFTRNEVTFSVSILLKNQLTTWSVLNCGKYPKKM